jgi:SAM-dependent methyltransferase
MRWRAVGSTAGCTAGLRSSAAVSRVFSDGSGGILAAGREAFHDRLPPRYKTDEWDLRFQEELASALRPGQSILDVGAGARPTVPPDQRPADVHYVGLDPVRDELERAPAGSYDDFMVAGAEERVEGHDGEFDLALSFMAMEHIKPLDLALNNIRAYMRPGGKLIAQLAGGRSPFALVNRMIPGPVARRILGRVQGRPPESVFPALYDRCTHSGLSEMLTGRWREWEVIPLHNAYGYVEFSRLLRAPYMAYEEWAYRRDRRNIAANYLILATA